MMAAGSAVLAGCATPIGDPDWQQFSAGDGTRISYRRWLPASTPKTVLQLVHGAAEHSSRYDRFAKLAVASGYAVYATDHRGHGRTRLRSGKTGDAGPDAWNRMVEDEIAFSQRLRTAHPGAKLVLFGHSLGSFMAQDYIERRADLLDALVLSGTSYRPAVPPQLIDLLNDAVRKEPLGDSAVWAGLFKDFNKPFGGTRRGRAPDRSASTSPHRLQSRTGRAKPQCRGPRRRGVRATPSQGLHHRCARKR